MPTKDSNRVKCAPANGQTMEDQLSRVRPAVDRESLVELGVVPAGLTIVAMAVAFGIVAALLLTLESVLLSNIVTRVLALVVMYLLPHFVAGLWFGRRGSVEPVAALAAGFAPIIFLVLAFLAFGGPFLTPVQVPLVTLGAIVVWSATFAGGTYLGARVLWPSLSDWESPLDGVGPF